MRKLLWGLILLTAFAVPVMAQVRVELQLNKNAYMLNESVFAKVKLRNYSGRHLVFGHDEKLRGELLFCIYGIDQVAIPLSGKGVFPMTGTVLKAGETKEIVVPLSKHYRIPRTGSYNVYAYIRHNMLKGNNRSKVVHFDVFRGSEVWRRTAGMPDILKTSDSENIKSRSYVLKTLPVEDKVFYYLQIEDKRNIYALFQLGRQVGEARYKADVDMLSRLHLLLPLSPRIFRYNVIDLTGMVEVDKYFKTTDTIPTLYRNPDSGRIIVVGGAEAVPGIDYKVRQTK